MDRAIRFSSIGLTIVIISSLIHYPVTNSIMDEDAGRMDQFGGGGSIEEQCGSITFEDMFIYDQAIFDIRIQDDWKTAEVEAKAWINWTLADDIREDLDSYLEDIIPSGGDGWLSTDEVGSVIMIAADCLQYSITRIGIRDGSPHRGGSGVDWQNTTWENDGMEIGEFNGVPERHSERRDCNSSFDDECYEIPVIPSSERDCDTEINQSLGLDECRVVLWLNATLEIDGISDPNDFTVSFNSSNMSNARLDFTFPLLPELRLDSWEECEGRYVGPDEENPGTDAPPIRGSCLGDGSSSHDLTENADGSLTYTLFPSLQRGTWPLGEDLFADFTTSPIPVDNPPTWTDAAPPNGTWIPVAEEGQNKLATWEVLSSWFDDESGVSNLEVVCSVFGSEDAGSGLAYQSIDRSLWIDVEGLVEVTCESLDSSGYSSGNRTWNVGVPVSISSSKLILEDPHPITVSVTEGWPEISVEVSLVQGGEPQNIVTVTTEGDEYLEVPSSGMVPGPVNVWLRAYQSQGNYMEKMYDLGISKESVPPQIFFSNTVWEDSSLKISGQYSDPDGEDVSISCSIGMVSVPVELSEVEITGNTWQVTWLNAHQSQLFLGDIYPLFVTGCDESGKCTTEEFEIKNEAMPLSADEGRDSMQDEDSPSEGSLPAPGLASMSLSMLFAIFFGRRRVER